MRTRVGVRDEGARARLLEELTVVSRRSMASAALFSQAVADRLGLHPTDLQCLNVLTLEDGPVPTSRVAALTGLTIGSATRLVDRLERAGYVVRRRDERDRRRVMVAAVPEKAAEFRRVWERLNGGLSSLFDDLDDAELRLVVAQLRRAADYHGEQVVRLRAGQT
jgi:DNA-binding MarR family transcriptional regulator